MKFEQQKQPILSTAAWLGRLLNSFLQSLLLILIALGIGVAGYRILGHLSWVDAILEASMILGGMGAIAPMHTNAVKLFASFYALFSGFIVLTTASIMLGPWIHRILHQFHAVIEDEQQQEP